MSTKINLQPSPSTNVFEGALDYKHKELVERLKQKLNLSEEAAQELFDDTKKYLCLCAVSDKPIAPPAAIDRGWHEFLMYTKDYQEFCIKHFGKFIHHVPKPVFKPHPVLKVSDTNKLAKHHFGNLSQNWRVFSNDCCPDYDCSGDGD